MDYERLERELRRLAIEAGAAIMAIYDRGEISVETKDDASPVTEADRAADAVICEGLATAFPDIPVVTEEQAASHDRTAARFFLVDPLDGTKEFIKRRGEFTVNIALVEDGTPTRGVVYAPAVGRLFYTDAGGRTVEEAPPFEADRVGALAPVACAKPDNRALRVVASKSHLSPETEAYIAKYKVAEFKSAGSSLKLCLVACGEADIYPRLGRTMEWDTAAGQAILLGAGGRLVCFDDQSPMTCGKPGHDNPYFIAVAPGVELAGR